MLASLLTGSLLLASAFSASVPFSAPVDLTSALTLASKLGIDPSGPPPSDAIPVPGGFTFTADSDAAHWVRAQLSLPPATLAARESSGMKVGIFVGSNCQGGGRYAENVDYNQQNVGDVNAEYHSILMATRQIRVNEQLDLSLRSGSDLCAVFKGSVTGRGTGCFNQVPYSCFRLIHF